MTTFPQTDNSPTPQNPQPCSSLPDFAALAAKLQETAQTLLDFAQANQSAINDKNDADDNPPLPEKPSEFRTYRLPGFIVEEEREMLKLSGAEDWQDIFHQTRSQIEILAILMLHFNEKENIDGSFLNQIAEFLLVPPLDMLSQLCSLVEEFRLQPESI